MAESALQLELVQNLDTVIATFMDEQYDTPNDVGTAHVIGTNNYVMVLMNAVSLPPGRNSDLTLIVRETVSDTYFVFNRYVGSPVWIVREIPSTDKFTVSATVRQINTRNSLGDFVQSYQFTV